MLNGCTSVFELTSPLCLFAQHTEIVRDLL
uniref:Uncharacterized protein n=1 Tax=Arundo donax TaxID=35708 RepID=A0A0A9CIA2_ARUDO